MTILDSTGGAPPPADEALGPVAHADPEALAMVLAREQPRTVALVLGVLDLQRAALILNLLPEPVRPQVIRRLAALESVAPEVLREVGQALQAELQAAHGGTIRRVDGKATAMSLLRRVPAARQTEVVAGIENDDPALAAELRGKLFSFEDLVNLGDRDVQTLLGEVDTARLPVALKVASAAVSDKLLKNMTSPAAEMMKHELAAMGPVRLVAVEAAQAELVNTALGLAEQGRITLVGPVDRGGKLPL